MDIKILGAHNIESRDSKYVSLLIDDVIAIDAGSLTSSLTFSAQQKLRPSCSHTSITTIPGIYRLWA